MLLCLCVAALAAANVDACQRCGLFGNRCKFVTPHVQQLAVAPVAVVKQPDVLIVQNNYPQPIAAQGQTTYGYQAAAAQYAVNPAETFRQAFELGKAVSATTSLAINGFNDMAKQQLALQAQIAEPLARGQAAAQVLNAAGLGQRANVQQVQTSALRVYQENGQLKVATEDPAQITAQIEARVSSRQPTSPTPAVQPTGNAQSILGQKCAQCHGLKLAQPKGELFVDAGHKLDCSTALKSVRLIRSGEMPKDGTLTDVEKTAAIDELLTLANLGGDP